MIVVTCDKVPGKEIKEVKGLVKGNTIRSRHMGKDIMAGFKTIVGGEITDYTKMMAESREQSLDRMIEEAEKIGANAIVAVRFVTTSVLQGTAELLVYGTAVIVE